MKNTANNFNKISEKFKKEIEKKMFDELMKNAKCSTCASATVVGFKDEDIKRLNELASKLNNMTPEERTLEATGGKYTTIFCESPKIRNIIQLEYGNLNIIISPLFCGQVVFFDNRMAPIKIIRGEK